MTDDDAHAIQAGARAQSAWDGVAPYFAEVQAEMTRAMVETGLEQQALRERLYMGIAALKRVETVIERAIGAGRFARQSADLDDSMTVRNAMAVEGMYRP